MPGPPRATYDVVIASDLRFPGGTSASIAEEVRAQAAAGYRTALLHLPTALLKRPRPLNSRIQRCVYEGLADLVRVDEPVHASLLVLRHPVVLSTLPRVPVDLTATHTVVVVNQAPADASAEEPFYDLATCRRNLTRLLGADAVWAPIGPLVRAALRAAPGAGELEVSREDWHNVLDPAEWATARSGVRGPRPVLGRHSRPHYRKWPASAEDILAAYPEDPFFDVRILGGADVPARTLGRVPANWTVRAFNEVPAVTFLEELDFFVYFHHAGLTEAFGRAILEALATGAVVILPHHFEALFGAACRYATPEEVAGLVRSLSADPAAYQAQSRRGVDLVERRFSHEVHARRVASWIGPAAPAQPRRRSRRVVPKPRLLFVTSNGGGLGHLTRVLALARRAGSAFQPLLFTLSQSYGLAREQGLPVEFCPSHDSAGLPRAAWQTLFTRRLAAVLETYRPAAVVFDGTNPYPGFADAREAYPDLPFIWSRRGLWRAGLGADNLDKAALFDHILEPGELAAAYDVGATATCTDPVPRTRVRPVTLLDTDELLPRAEAAAGLGIDPARLTVLVDLTDGDAGQRARTTEMVLAHLRRAGVQVVAPSARTSTRATLSGEGICAPQVFPLSRYARACDIAVSATGYNTFHELVRFGVPAVWIPKPVTALDDQDARARYAADSGVGRAAPGGDEDRFVAALADLLDPDARRGMREAGWAADPGNGAADAIARIEQLAACDTVPAAAAPVKQTGGVGADADAHATPRR